VSRLMLLRADGLLAAVRGIDTLRLLLVAFPLFPIYERH
jgi:hypothetical protein